MKLVKTDDFNKIQAFNTQIFNDLITENDVKNYIHRKGHDADPEYFLLLNETEEVGFAVCCTQMKNQFFTIWLIGVSAAHRNKGYGDFFYKELERYYKDKGIFNIEVVTYNKRRDMLNLLLKNDFEITKTEYSDKRNDTKIVFKKNIVSKKEVRISLTKNCNLKCFFCHNEGLDFKERDAIDVEKIYSLLNELIQKKYTDITFTGGEPLLEKHSLLLILEKLNQLEEKPDITIVTNGVYLDLDFVDELKKYRGKLKVNMSFHYFNAEDFHQITGAKKEFFDTIKTNLENAAKSGLNIKANCVVLRGIHNNKEKMLEFINYLSNTGIKVLKLLELLVTKDNHELFSYYYELESLAESLKEDITLSKKELRRDVYKLNSNPDFSIEFQKLTCKFGCLNCEFIRDRTIDTNFNYFPCFIQGTEPIKINDFKQIPEYFIQGDRIINANAQKYGNSSPLLRMAEKYVESETEIFYCFEKTELNRVLEYFNTNSLILRDKKLFHLEHFRPKNFSKDWEAFNKVLEIGCDSHNENKIFLIYIDNEFIIDKDLFSVKKRFLNETGPIIISRKEYESHYLPIIKKMDMEQFLSYDYSVDLYKNGCLSLSLCEVKDYYTVRISNYQEFESEYSAIIKALDLKPIKSHHLQFVMEKLKEQDASDNLSLTELLEKPSVPNARAAAEILSEAEMLLGIYAKREKIIELENEFITCYPMQSEDFKKLKNREKQIYELPTQAYRIGTGKNKLSIEDLLNKAKILTPHNYGWLKKKLIEQFENGKMAKNRHDNELQNKAQGKQLSSVKPRPNHAGITIFPDNKSRSEKVIPSPPNGLHPNDIRNLQPANNWLLIIDETGDKFSKHDVNANGKFIGIMINKNESNLPHLPEFHAVSEDIDSIDNVFQHLLDEQCGILGLTMNSLPFTNGECWFDGVQKIIEMVVRLLPLSINGKSKIEVFIENRDRFKANDNPKIVERNIIERFAKIWPNRAKLIDLSISIISKNGSPYNGYADVIAFTWGSPTGSSKERLIKSKLLDTCLLNSDSNELAGFWDNWDAPNGISGADWTKLISSPDSRNPASLTNTLLNALADSCKTDKAKTKTYLSEIKKHLESKSINLSLMKSQIEWLVKVIPEEELLPEMKLMWLTAKLAYANHIGATEADYSKELQLLSNKHFNENAPLVCDANLNLAVNYTNRFDFVNAANTIAAWENVEVAIPGLQYWGRMRSTMGQHKAFMGENTVAVSLFNEAIEAFRKLSDPESSRKELSHTMAYRVIAMIDDISVNNHDVQLAIKEYFETLDLASDLKVAAKVFAESTDDKWKYAHHIFLRWLVARGNNSVLNAYLSNKDSWESESGHPWQLISLYRGILLYEKDKASALKLAIEAAGIAFSDEHGPTVKLIGAVCRAIAHSWGDEWKNSAEFLQKLKNDLPLAEERIDLISAWMNGNGGDVKAFIAKVLPFNFR